VSGLKRAAVALLTVPVLFYRRFLSPLFPPVCRFEPTCSEYALDALRIHGPLKGLALTAKRLSRCHPITWLGGSQGFDPVPPE
jgi:putative membrane protein insertion efficiency factor